MKRHHLRLSRIRVLPVRQAEFVDNSENVIQHWSLALRYAHVWASAASRHVRVPFRDYVPKKPGISQYWHSKLSGFLHPGFITSISAARAIIPCRNHALIGVDSSANKRRVPPESPYTPSAHSLSRSTMPRTPPPALQHFLRP